MFRNFLRFALLLTFFALTGCNIEGTITSYDNQGLAGVTVLLSGDATATAVTDSDGHFIFQDLDRGIYTVSPVLDGFTFTPQEKSVEILGQNVSGVDFMAEPDNLIRVPNDYSTIQEAVDAAADGSTILIADGTYSGIGNYDVEVFKPLSIRSVNGPSRCIIDCQDMGRGFNIGAEVELIGLTITNGFKHSGGGIYVDRGAPLSIKDCVIQKCHATYDGGGISQSGGYPVIENTIISDNTTDGQGGGIYFSYTYPELKNCIISNNSAQKTGGGLAGDYTNITMDGCQVINNLSNSDSGGGANFGYGTQHIVNSLFAGNQGSVGGLLIIYGEATILNCTFSDNFTQKGDYYGKHFAAVSFRGSEGTAHIISNSIIWGNSSDQPENPQLYVDNSVQLTLTYSNVGEEGFNDIGVINADPMFVDTGDYHLAIDSPCIDAGIDSGLIQDLDGNTRPQGDGYDMGAYEFTSTP